MVCGEKENKKEWPAISAADSGGTSCVENVKRVKVVKNKSNDVSEWKVVILFDATTGPHLHPI